MICVGAQVRRSHIHGHGLFATEDIPRGSLVGAFEGRIYTRDQMTRAHPQFGHCVWFFGPNKIYVALLPNDDLLYLNHSKDPTLAVHENIILVARRDIKMGDELTFDYGSDWE